MAKLPAMILMFYFPYNHINVWFHWKLHITPTFSSDNVDVAPLSLCYLLTLCFQFKRFDGTVLQFHVRCATEFKTCYVVWRSPATGVLALCHPDTIKVMQSSNAPKSDMYRFSKPFFGKREKKRTSFPLLQPWRFLYVTGVTPFCNLS